MATVSGFLGWRHLRAEPNQFVLHYRKGRLTRQGPGLAYWFHPLSASIAQVPVEDCETTFLLRERTADLQEVSIQCTIVFRFADAEKAAKRANFTISTATGQWIEKPLERIGSFWAQRAREPARSHLVHLSLSEAVQTGAATLQAAIDGALMKDTEPAAMGLVLVGVQIDQIAPAPELTKALEAPTRESIQQRADEAVFQRRALAVEKERAIKENELSTQVELARRQDDLIRRTNANKQLEAEGKAAAERTRIESEVAMQATVAEGYARDVRAKAQGEADARRAMGEAEAAAELARANAWRGVPSEVLLGLAAQALAAKLQTIEHVTITPDTLSEMIGKMVRNKGEV